MIGLPENNLIFLFGILLLPPLAGIIHRLPIIKIFYCLHHKFLFISRKGGIHGQAKAVSVIVFGFWEIARLVTQALVIGHEVNGYVVYLCEYLVFAQIIIESATIFHFNNVKVKGVTLVVPCFKIAVGNLRNSVKGLFVFPGNGTALFNSSICPVKLALTQGCLKIGNA